ncbi:MAG TPA: hypothetical protein VGP14_02875 [Casimicrobiaceae bacterium]|nr:hypothetical protein [Casimicrobiaceae bacterium]
MFELRCNLERVSAAARDARAARDTHPLSLRVVAEGVETEEQSRLPQLLNCDEMQAFLHSKPVPAEIFETRFLAPLLTAK